MIAKKCSEEMPPHDHEVLVYCDKPVAGRGGSRGWYIAFLHPNPRDEYSAYELKPNEAGWVTSESYTYGQRCVLILDNVSEWWELPARGEPGDTKKEP